LFAVLFITYGPCLDLRWALCQSLLLWSPEIIQTGPIYHLCCQSWKTRRSDQTPVQCITAAMIKSAIVEPCTLPCTFQVLMKRQPGKQQQEKASLRCSYPPPSAKTRSRHSGLVAARADRSSPRLSPPVTAEGRLPHSAAASAARHRGR
jgi:hypothetical protein